MNFFDKINNYLIVNAIKEILKGRDPEESLPEGHRVGGYLYFFTVEYVST